MQCMTKASNLCIEPALLLNAGIRPQLHSLRVGNTKFDGHREGVSGFVADAY